jgi:hypothetical protein
MDDRFGQAGVDRQQRRAATRQARVAGPARTPVGVGELFQRGFSDHQSGRLTAAEAAYRQVLVIQPDHIDALHLLGVIAHQEGAKDQAVRYMRRAIALHATLRKHTTISRGRCAGWGGWLRQAVARRFACGRIFQVLLTLPRSSEIFGRRLCMPARKPSAARLRPSTSGS